MVEITLFVFQTIALFSMIYLTNLRNPIHSVFLLILVFANVGGILLILAVEFLAIVYIIVYLGAIAVLFLFVIMMLDIKLSPVSDKKFYYAPVAILITFVIATECAYVLEASIPEASFLGPIYTSFSVLLNEINWNSSPCTIPFSNRTIFPRSARFINSSHRCHCTNN